MIKYLLKELRHNGMGGYELIDKELIGKESPRLKVEILKELESKNFHVTEVPNYWDDPIYAWRECPILRLVSGVGVISYRALIPM